MHVDLFGTWRRCDSCCEGGWDPHQMTWGRVQVLSSPLEWIYRLRGGVVRDGVQWRQRREAALSSLRSCCVHMSRPSSRTVPVDFVPWSKERSSHGHQCLKTARCIGSHKRTFAMPPPPPQRTATPLFNSTYEMLPSHLLHHQRAEIREQLTLPIPFPACVPSPTGLEDRTACDGEAKRSLFNASLVHPMAFLHGLSVLFFFFFWSNGWPRCAQ